MAKETLAIEALEPRGPGEGVPRRFAWQTSAPPPFELVVFDAGYRELARVPAIAHHSVRPDAALAARLGTGGVFHWCVQAGHQQGVVRSALAAFEIR